MIVPRISKGIQCNMACDELGTSGHGILNTQGKLSAQTGKNTSYAEYAQHSCVTASTILEDIWHNMA